MKILKLKSILFSLMAITMVTVFLTSCEEDKLPIPTDDIQKSELEDASQDLIKDSDFNFYLPSRLDDADQKTIDLYLSNLTDEEWKGLEESYKIEKYLESINRAEEVYNDLGQPDMLTLNDLSKYTTEQELADFKSFDVNSVIELRSICTNIFRTRCIKADKLQNPDGTLTQLYKKIKQEYCLVFSLTGGGGKWKTVWSSNLVFKC